MVFRIQPKMPAASYTTYQVLAPRATHWRRVGCAEAQCPRYERGWKTIVDETTDLGARQAHYIRRESGRRYTETRDAGLTTFGFEAGQRCFGSDAHKVPLDRPQIFRRHGGDWRGNPRGDVLTHVRSDDWLDDFANHQDRLATRLQQG
jgi:hypothetical protein